MSFAPGEKMQVAKSVYSPLVFDQKQTFVIEEGASNASFVSVPAPTQTGKSLILSVIGSGEATVLNPHARITGKLNLVLTGTQSNPNTPLLVDGACAPVAYIIQSSSSDATLKYNGKQVSTWNPQIVLPALLHYNSEYLNSNDVQPIALDNCASFDTYIGTTRNVLGNYTTQVPGCDFIPRGAYQGITWTIVRNDVSPASNPSATVLTAVVEITLNEPLFFPSNAVKRDDLSGFINVKTMTYQFSTDFSSAFNVAPSSGASITSITAGNNSTITPYSNVGMEIVELLPNSLSDIPNEHPYPYYEFNVQSYALPNNLVSSDTPVSVSLQGIQLNAMPQSVLLFASDTTRSPSTPTRYMRLEKMLMKITGKDNLMASYDAEDYYAMSRENGLKDNYLEYKGQAYGANGAIIPTGGAPTMLNFGSNIPIGDSRPNQNIPTSIDFTNIQFTNTFGQTVEYSTFYAVFITGGTTFVRGVSEVVSAVGIVSQSDILKATRIQKNEYGGSFFSSIKDFYNSKVKPVADVVSKGISIANKFAGNGMSGGTMLQDGEVYGTLSGGRALPKKKVKKSLY